MNGAIEKIADPDIRAKVEWFVKYAIIFGTIQLPINRRKGRKYTQRGPKFQPKDIPSDAKIASMRQELNLANNLGKLNENQSAALEGTRNMRVKSMSIEQKRQIISMYEDYRKAP